MARKRSKKRTHVVARNVPSNGVKANSSASTEPRSMVIRIGAGGVGSSVSQLVHDFRAIMEPGTASRLKERRSNRLRDYTTMAGPLGVSHLLLFSRSATGNTNLRLARTPRGPTLHLRVEKYSLCKDVQKAQKHPHGGGKEFLTAPLLVMNNFSTLATADNAITAVPKQLEKLTASVFQSLFPPISPQTTPLSSIRRVLLLNRELPQHSPAPQEAGSYILHLRHYAITTNRTRLSRGIRRLNATEKLMKRRNTTTRRVPNLGKLNDVADYLLDPSVTALSNGEYTSGSESEVETDAEIEILEKNTRKVLSKKQMAALRSSNGDGKVQENSRLGVEKRAVKLVELGPRMKLRLTKLEEGLCGGKVIWHEFVEKSSEEVNEMESLWEKKRIERDVRKKEQNQNVERKKRDKGQIRENVNEVNGRENIYEDDDEWYSESLEGHSGMEPIENEHGAARG